MSDHRTLEECEQYIQSLEARVVELLTERDRLRGMFDSQSSMLKHASETAMEHHKRAEALREQLDMMESNARIQAKLLADTARERDAMRNQLVKRTDALNLILGLWGVGSIQQARDIAYAALTDDLGGK